MSAVLRQKRHKSKPISTTALWLVLGLALLFFVVQYGQQLFLEHDLKGKAAAQRISNAELRDQTLRLKASLEYYRSDKYIEQRAREDLNLRRADEEVLIPVAARPGDDLLNQGDVIAPATGAIPVESVPEPRPNWLQWFDLFRATP